MTDRPTAGRSFERFFAEEYAATVRLAHLLTGSNAHAEDLAQDAFARVLPHLDRLDNPAAYLRTAIVNGCRTWHLVGAHTPGSVSSSFGGYQLLTIGSAGTTFETGVGADAPSTLALTLWSTPGGNPAFAEVLLGDGGENKPVDFGALFDDLFGASEHSGRPHRRRRHPVAGVSVHGLLAHDRSHRVG